MKRYHFSLIFTLLLGIAARAQTRNVRGTVTDSTKVALPGTTVKLAIGKDTLATATSAKGYFRFNAVKASQITLVFSAVGYQGLIRHYTLVDSGTLSVDTIILKADVQMLNQVTITGVNPVTFKEDTIQYKASAYRVRDNAPIEDVIRKLPGVDVDASGNITAQGKQVTRVRVNGKDFFDGDVQSATRNLPADIVENIQIIDDYGDQANLTGIKTGDPTKIMNITIKADRNHGYTGQGTLGDGSDALPKGPGVHNDNRYLGLLNDFIFNGDQQVAFLGNVNNTNVNTFSFGTPAGPPSGGGGNTATKKLAVNLAQAAGNKISIGSGGAGNFTNQSATLNGITDTHAFGTNFRDQWGKRLSVYGSYSFSDNTVMTTTNTLQQNSTLTDPGSSSQTSQETDKNINHRLQWNMEYKPDASNYLKITPLFSYASTNGSQSGETSASRNDTITTAYSSVTGSTMTSPAYGLTALYDHRFKKQGRNLSINFSMNAAKTDAYQNPVNHFTAGPATAPADQHIYTLSHTNNYGATLSYLEPVAKFSYLELNYAFNRSVADNNKATDVLDTVHQIFYRDSSLSNQYHYSFTTNRIGLNFRYAQTGKYNYTIGLAMQPVLLDGQSPLTGLNTHVSTFNIIPTAHLVYNLSKNEIFGLNYSGTSNQPTFQQLQPVTDFSNALYPVTGNPDLKPSFTNSLSLQYNRFSFETGKTLFTNFSFAQTQDQVVTNTTIYPVIYQPSPGLANTYLTQYRNASGYYAASGFISYATPWDNRRYTLLLSGTVSYTHNIGFITNVAPLTYDQTTVENIARNLVFTPGLRFRADFPEVIDAQFLTNYAVNRTFNSVQDELTNATANVRTWNIAVSGKNYFHDWTLSYDYSKAINYGYASSVHATNPNILNTYLERRFLKGHRAAVRLAAFDLFNQNTGFSTSSTASYVTQTNTNRLGRYYLASFTLRLQKFAGK